MPAVTISVPALQRHAPGLDAAVAADLIRGALARAAVIAPCITEDGFTFTDAATSIIRDAILRRVHNGAGAVAVEIAGPFQQRIDTTRGWGRAFSVEEQADLRALCVAYRQLPAEQAVSLARMPASPLDDRRYVAAMYPPRPVRPYGRS